MWIKILISIADLGFCFTAGYTAGKYHEDKNVKVGSISMVLLMMLNLILIWNGA